MLQIESTLNLALKIDIEPNHKQVEFGLCTCFCKRMEKDSPEILFSGKQKLKQKETIQSSYTNQDKRPSFVVSTDTRSSSNSSEQFPPHNLTSAYSAPLTHLSLLPSNREKDGNIIFKHACKSNDSMDLSTANTLSFPMETDRIFIPPMEPNIYVGPPENWEKITGPLPVNPYNCEMNLRRPSIVASQQDEHEDIPRSASENSIKIAPNKKGYQSEEFGESSCSTAASKDTWRILELETLKYELNQELQSHKDDKEEASGPLDSGESSNRAQTRGNSPIPSDTETDEKKHVCKLCSRSFSRPSALKTHMYTHTGEKPFTCTYRGCEKRFSVESNLRRHYRLHLSHERHLHERFSHDTYDKNVNPHLRQPHGFYPPPS